MSAPKFAQNSPNFISKPFFHPRMLARCRHRYDEAMRKMFCFWHEHKREKENSPRRAATNTNATNFRVECCQTKVYVLASLEFFFLIASRFVSVSANVIFITFFSPVAFSLVFTAQWRKQKSEIFIATWIIDDCKLLCQFSLMWTLHEANLKAQSHSQTNKGFHFPLEKAFVWTFVCIDLDLDNRESFLRKMWEWKMLFVSNELFPIVFQVVLLTRRSKSLFNGWKSGTLRFCFVIQSWAVL